MKKIFCIILGIIIGVSGCNLYNIYSNKNNSSAQEESTNMYDKTEDYTPEDIKININAYNNHSATLEDDIGFPMPSWDLINSYQREGNDIIYDMQDNGKGVLINFYGIGMQKVIATIFVTSDYGRNWEIVEKETSFNSGSLSVLYVNDTIVIINTVDVTFTTSFTISNDNGKTFKEKTNHISSFAELIGKPLGTYITAYPVILSKDLEKNTILCAWCNDNYKPAEVLLISEHYVPTFEITKEYYRNKTAIEKYISE